MKHILQLVVLFCMTTLTLSAQEKKAFTLEDVIPGGSNYFNLVPENIPGLGWWGDICIQAGVDEVKTIDVKNGKEKILFTLNEVNETIKNGDKPYKLTHELKPLHSLMAVQLPWADKTIALFRQSNYMMWYDFAEKKITKLAYLNNKAANFDFCKENGLIAYTVGSNLHVAEQGDFDKQVSPSLVAGKEEGETGVLYGQSVHRNEFGIMKGTFWSPKGTYLAFYRMDQSMVTDYPQVNTSTRIATPEPDKYPMAGMTSHKVTVGVYNVKTGKMVYLQAGDPTDRYFTNISWAPNEQHIYVIELNRDQNHSQLVRYNAVSGAKEAVVYEEKHPKYVEPQHPLTFLPWDDSKFIYWSQRSGFQHLYLMDTQKKTYPEKEKGEDGETTIREYLQVTPLTQGDWLVQEILGFNAAKKEIIIGSTEVSPLQTNIYTLNVKTGKRTLIGKQDGTHQASLSANGTYLIDKFTSFSVPREISILPTNGKKGVNLLTATDPMYEQYNMPEITIGTIKAADGVTDLYYRLIKPVDFDPNKKYPAIIYVY